MNPANSPASIQSTFIGSAAQQILRPTGALRIAGTTSRGVFLQCAPRQVIFLSTERYRGPLTLNLASRQAAELKRLTPETSGVHTPEGILFPGVSLQIDLRRAQVWRPTPPIAASPTPQPGFALQAYQRKPKRGFAPLIPAILARQAENRHPQEDVILAMRAALHKGHWEQIPLLAEALIGYGGGLTPSGDDLLLGMLLALHRWGDALGLKTDLSKLKADLAFLAQTRTTAISAGLIACAGDGLSDERLIRALDALMGVLPPSEKILDELLGWGNSSGLDALTGMLLTLPTAPYSRL